MRIDDESMFAADSYGAVRKPLLEASTLPPACYTSERFFRREIECAFFPYWQFVGREEQLECPGSYVCYEGVGGSVIILRGAEGELRAFANSCRPMFLDLMAMMGLRAIAKHTELATGQNNGDDCWMPTLLRVDNKLQSKDTISIKRVP